MDAHTYHYSTCYPPTGCMSTHMVHGTWCMRLSWGTKWQPHTCHGRRHLPLSHMLPWRWVHVHVHGTWHMVCEAVMGIEMTATHMSWTRTLTTIPHVTLPPGACLRTWYMVHGAWGCHGDRSDSPTHVMDVDTIKILGRGHDLTMIYN